MSPSDLLSRQQIFFHSGQTRNLAFRKQALLKLRSAIEDNEDRLADAIFADFKKSKFETVMTELSPLKHEINTAIRHLKCWAKPRRVTTDLANLPASSWIIPEPYGCSLVIGAWNYPYLLTLGPLVAALAAGNTCIIKPSEVAPNTSAAMAGIINEQFSPDLLHAVEGGHEVSNELLKLPFNKIFFTGSTRVGRIVARAAAEHLIPVTLELGGKSPCVVLKDANLKLTAQRIAWGKCLNAGQTCIAPDYLLIEQEIYEPFLIELAAQMRKSESYVRIVDDRHMQRLVNLIDKNKVFSGGNVNPIERYIEPTILRDVLFDDPIMQEEIFGPLLPTIPFTNLDTVLTRLKSLGPPLAFYVFTNNRSVQDRLLREVPFGGGAVNDVVMHISNPRLPFGGLGQSGLGSSHGEFGFRAFSHYKGVLRKPLWFELPIKYVPYRPWKETIIRWILG